MQGLWRPTTQKVTFVNLFCLFQHASDLMRGISWQLFQHFRAPDSISLHWFESQCVFTGHSLQTKTWNKNTAWFNAKAEHYVHIHVSAKHRVLQHGNPVSSAGQGTGIPGKSYTANTIQMKWNIELLLIIGHLKEKSSSHRCQHPPSTNHTCITSQGIHLDPQISANWVTLHIKHKT